MSGFLKTIFLLVITFLIALSGSHNVINTNNIPITLVCFIITFLIHYIVFYPLLFLKQNDFLI